MLEKGAVVYSRKPGPVDSYSQAGKVRRANMAEIFMGKTDLYGFSGRSAAGSHLPAGSHGKS